MPTPASLGASIAEENEAEQELQAYKVELNEGHADTITVLVHVKEKIIAVPCGFGTQQVIWLGHVAIARYDDENHQGWLELGIPVRITKDGDKRELRMTDLICDVLRDRSHVYLTASLE